jgi:hypothetical protein
MSFFTLLRVARAREAISSGDVPFSRRIVTIIRKKLSRAFLDACLHAFFSPRLYCRS